MRSIRFALLGALLCLSACAGGNLPIPLKPLSQADLQTGFNYACAGVSFADGAFLASSPALVAAGKLTASDVAKEKSIKAVVDVTCDPKNPPADIQAASLELLGDASAIYLLTAQK